MANTNSYKGFEHGIDIIKPPYKALLFQALKLYQEQLYADKIVSVTSENELLYKLLTACSEMMNYIEESTATTDIRKLL